MPPIYAPRRKLQTKTAATLPVMRRGQRRGSTSSSNTPAPVNLSPPTTPTVDMEDSDSEEEREVARAVEPPSRMTNGKGKAIDGPFYEIEYIECAEVFSEKKLKQTKKFWAYKVKWFGYDASQNSWTTEDSFTKGSDIVRSFWRDVNPGRESTAPSVMVRSVGYRVKSSKEWKNRRSRDALRARSPIL